MRGTRRRATCGYRGFKLLRRAVGLPTSTRKDATPPNRMLLPGADVSLSDGIIRESAPAGLASKIRPKIAHSLHSGRLSPASARRLLGKLGFYTSLLVGMIGRRRRRRLFFANTAIVAPVLRPDFAGTWRVVTAQSAYIRLSCRFPAPVAYRASRVRRRVGTYCGCVCPS